MTPRHLCGKCGHYELDHSYDGGSGITDCLRCHCYTRGDPHYVPVGTPGYRDLTSRAMPEQQSGWGTPQQGAATPPSNGKKSLSAYGSGSGGQYLKAADIPRPTWFRVTGNSMEEIGEDDPKLVLALQGSDGKTPSLVVNKTNARNLASMGKNDDPDGLTGRFIMLGVQQVEYQGKLVAGIRVLDVANEVPH